MAPARGHDARTVAVRHDGMTTVVTDVNFSAGRGGLRHGLVGRDGERARLADLVAAVRQGESRALVLVGEAGVGKTALLHHAGELARGCAVLTAVGVESEMELAYAGVHQLCAPLLDDLGTLPGPQRDALRTAFGLMDGDAPDRFLVGLAVLGLLSEAARRRPVVCLVDDVQWLDEASVQTLAFVARRLQVEAVGILVSARDSLDEELMPGLPQLAVEGLQDAYARDLLSSAMTGPLDERVRERIVAETRGNPLALVQVARGMSSDEAAGGFGLTGPGPLSNRIEHAFGRRLAVMPAATRRLLVVAAAEPGQDPTLIWRAAERLGVGVHDAEPAVADEFVSLTGRVRFCHPLARSTVYKTAPPDERRAAHGALADATDPRTDPERRAWHRAHATAGLDEDVAAELERSAGRAQARGGRAAAAAFHERAAELTPAPDRRAERALVAAAAKSDAGSLERALRLLSIAEAGPPDETRQARIGLLRAQIMSRMTPGSGVLMLAAARRLEPLDPALARDAYRDAFYAAHIAGRLGEHDAMTAVAEATRRAAAGWEPGPYHRVLDGLAAIVTEGYGAGADLVAEGVRAVRDGDGPVDEALPWLPLACRVAFDVWDCDSALALSSRMISVVRGRGNLGILHTALMLKVGHCVLAGDLRGASSLADECDLIIEATSIPKPPYGAVVAAAWRGDDRRTSALIDQATPAAIARGEGQWLTATGWAEAVLNNGLGRYQQAYEAAVRGSEHQSSELAIANWAKVELVEAAVRSGHAERAVEAAGQLTEMAAACGTAWILGVASRSRALTSGPADAEDEYRAALGHLRRTPLRSELLRTHLLLGEWLRREGRRIDAREQLRTALEGFSEIGATAFAERARKELAATGEHLRRGPHGSRPPLTEQEARIARLAADRRTNTEIAGQLFLSPRTVEWHLGRIFTKLGVASRRELESALQHAEVALPT